MSDLFSDFFLIGSVEFVFLYSMLCMLFFVELTTMILCRLGFSGKVFHILHIVVVKDRELTFSQSKKHMLSKVNANGTESNWLWQQQRGGEVLFFSVCVGNDWACEIRWV